MAIYFAAISIATVAAMGMPQLASAEAAITPALALMLFVTFLQVPLRDLGRALTRGRFLGALLVSNFGIVPILAVGLIQLLPADPLIRFGVMLVLLCPCIDYVVTFSHLGKADAKLLLAATPILLVTQMAALPAFLGVFLGEQAAALVEIAPFVHAFVWLIGVPLALAAATQLLAGHSSVARHAKDWLGLLPTPSTALVLFLVFASVVPQLGLAIDAAVSVLPIYVVYAVAAPLLGWVVARGFALESEAGRAVAFSAATRNSLVVLPLGLTVPGAMPVLPAIIVAQTVVELFASLLYIRLMPRLKRPLPAH